MGTRRRCPFLEAQALFVRLDCKLQYETRCGPEVTLRGCLCYTCAAPPSSVPFSLSPSLPRPLCFAPWQKSLIGGGGGGGGAMGILHPVWCPFVTGHGAARRGSAQLGAEPQPPQRRSSASYSGRSQPRQSAARTAEPARSSNRKLRRVS